MSESVKRRYDSPRRRAQAAETRRQILIYSAVLVAITLAILPLGVAGPVYGVPAVLMGAGFLYFAYRLWRSASLTHAAHLFRYSILYLFLLFTALALDAGLKAWAGVR